MTNNNLANPPIDSLGNKLDYDDLVLVHLEQPFICGKVVDIKAPSGLDVVSVVSMPSPAQQAQNATGFVRVVCEITIPYLANLNIITRLKVLKEPKQGPAVVKTKTPAGPLV